MSVYHLCYCLQSLLLLLRKVYGNLILLGLSYFVSFYFLLWFVTCFYNKNVFSFFSDSFVRIAARTSKTA